MTDSPTKDLVSRLQNASHFLEEYKAQLAEVPPGLYGEAATEILRLRGDFARIYQATIDNPEKLTIGDIAKIAKDNAT